MNRIVRFFAVAASVGGVVLVLSLTSAGPALAQPFKPLMALIINDATNPVPVVDVGTPTPVPEPFQHQVSSFVPSSLTLQVPENKRLVIEFYSGTAGTEVPCATAAMTIKTDVAGGSMQHRLLAIPVEQGQPSDFNQYTVSEQVRLYAAPGSVVQFAASTIPTCPAAFLGVVSGYLIDVP
jgi:hypothetical protein